MYQGPSHPCYFQLLNTHSWSSSLLFVPKCLVTPACSIGFRATWVVDYQFYPCVLPILPKFVLLVNFLGLLLTSGANVTDEIWVISAGSPIQTDFALLGPSVLRPLKPVLYVYVISSFITNFPHTSFLYHVYDWRYSLCDRKTIYTELVCGEIICGEIVLLSVPFFSMASSSF